MPDARSIKSDDAPAPLPEPLDPQGRPPLDQYCDLVLKGGVVDGVIYPGVLVELARHYRFQSIAGTSVGAIAASLAAASEYARRFGSDDGFNEVLRKIPEELAEFPNPDQPETKLRTLFQTEKSLNRLFKLFVEVASVPMAKVVGTFLRTLWSSYRGIFVAGFVSGFIALEVLTLFFSSHVAIVFLSTKVLAVLWAGILGSAIGGLLTGLVFIAVAIRREYKDLAGSNGWGFCSGMSTDGGKTEALIEWLHKGIQGAAKLPHGRPLTFQDLWDAPGGPKQENGQPEQKSIDLRMISTAVSHGRPYELPVDDPSIRLFFKLSELKDYFPECILLHLEKTALPYTTPEKYYAIDPVRTKNADWWCDPDPNDVDPGDFRELPVGDLPVLVAVRMSMNFPILFKAVPLWAVDSEAGPINDRRGEQNRPFAPIFRKVWFTDGGVTSNFPIHIFDAPVPTWPTFGVFIEEKSRSNRSTGDLDKRKPFWLPAFHTVGRSEKWMDIKEDSIADERSDDLNSGFASYLKAVVFTAKDWADHANMRMPGVRDRVVTVYKNGETNGGLNLKLKPHMITNLGYRNGVAAGRALVQKFLTNTTIFNEHLQGTPGWLDHRWVRLNSYVTALRVHLKGFNSAINNESGTSTIALQIDQARQKAPLYFEKYFEPTLTNVQAEALKKAVVAIQALETALAADKIVQPYTPKPRPELKNRARI